MRCSHRIQNVEYCYLACPELVERYSLSPWQTVLASLELHRKGIVIALISRKPHRLSGVRTYACGAIELHTGRRNWKKTASALAVSI